ncbi:hypothetical protein [Hymenobacter fodinae]|uniref:hypothetical protein n=1 Tax=Hymenobacter fodinae TaxID=2510796 RepID=UPI0014367775|nr:hypothetical protein [Hymenobacter fodinae]
MNTLDPTSAPPAAEALLNDEYIQLDFEVLEQLECELHPVAEPEENDRMAA